MKLLTCRKCGRICPNDVGPGSNPCRAYSYQNIEKTGYCLTCEKEMNKQGIYFVEKEENEITARTILIWKGHKFVVYGYRTTTSSWSGFSWNELTLIDINSLSIIKVKNPDLFKIEKCKMGKKEWEKIKNIVEL